MRSEPTSRQRAHLDELDHSGLLAGNPPRYPRGWLRAIGVGLAIVAAILGIVALAGCNRAAAYSAKTWDGERHAARDGRAQ